MKRFIIALVALSLLLMGVTLAVAKDMPQALKKVDLSKAQKVTDKEAQKVRGSGTCIDPVYNYNYLNLYSGPGPHKK